MPPIAGEGDPTGLLALAADCLRQIQEDVTLGLDVREVYHRTAGGLRRLIETLERAASTDAQRALGTIVKKMRSAPSVAGQQERPLGRVNYDHLNLLTDREREVWRRASQGVPYVKIASKLDITVETVYSHMRNVRKKYPELKARATSTSSRQ